MEMERGKGTMTQAMSPASVAGDDRVTSKLSSFSSEVAGDGATTSNNHPAETDVEAAQAEAAAESEGCRSAMADDKQPAAAVEGAGTKRKRTKLIKYHKDHAEFVLRRGRPTLPPPVRRPSATQLEIAADAQKQIDRYDQIWEQYMEKGEAEIEVTDGEEEDEEEEEEEEEGAEKVVGDLDTRFPPGSLFPLGDKMVTIEELLVIMGTPAA